MVSHYGQLPSLGADFRKMKCTKHNNNSQFGSQP